MGTARVWVPTSVSLVDSILQLCFFRWVNLPMPLAVGFRTTVMTDLMSVPEGWRVHCTMSFERINAETNKIEPPLPLIIEMRTRNPFLSSFQLFSPNQRISCIDFWAIGHFLSSNLIISFSRIKCRPHPPKKNACKFSSLTTTLSIF